MIRPMGLMEATGPDGPNRKCRAGKNKYYDRKNKYYDRNFYRCDRKNGDYVRFSSHFPNFAYICGGC